VFDRFYRRASSEGERGQETGSGLGLAIVRNIADRHMATVQLRDSSYGGLRVAVRFPRRLAPTEKGFSGETAPS
jgi:two-component system OmpR family sensor kinase